VLFLNVVWAVVAAAEGSGQVLAPLSGSEGLGVAEPPRASPALGLCGAVLGGEGRLLPNRSLNPRLPTLHTVH